MKRVLGKRTFTQALELGCGTGKNTERLGERCTELLAVDFSEGMLSKAKEKIILKNVRFAQADLTKPWTFIVSNVDLITTSLVLEHVEALEPIFRKAAAALNPGGFFYVCELHPFKQYNGSKARFETGNGTFELECFVHHVSDYFDAAIRCGFQCVDMQEWFDNDDRNSTPRLISFLFQTKA